jgi:hypothetical protein
VDTPVEQHGGPLAIGELLSVWHRGEMLLTDPAQVCPEYVVSDPAPRE